MPHPRLLGFHAASKRSVYLFKPRLARPRLCNAGLREPALHLLVCERTPASFWVCLSLYVGVQTVSASTTSWIKKSSVRTHPTPMWGVFL